ncbi:MAG: exosortase E/protease, VPEID-CTERM system [Terracidiphilus sp.]|jgi:exosortase E/protease (VPEID-CTERM system)
MNSDRSSAEISRVHAVSASLLPRHLLGRFYLFGALVALEYIFCFSGKGRLPGHVKIFGVMTDPYGQIPLFAYVVFLSLGHSIWKAQKENIPFGRIFFGFHLLFIAAVLSITLGTQKGPGWLLYDPFGYIRSSLCLPATILLALACVPLRSWVRAIRSTGLLWLYSSLAGVAGWYLGTLIKLLWTDANTAQSATMQTGSLYAVRAILSVFLPDVVIDPTSFVIGTPRYMVTIAAGCSGVEGFALALLFTSIWLWYFRKEYRFPQALLLIPCALACMWLLNIVRLCALIFIGDAGYPDVSDIGFHSAAGWISFIIIALLFSQATQRLSWMRKIPPAASSFAGPPHSAGVECLPGAPAQFREERGESPAIRAYLVPFLAILAATFVSKAASGNLEWLYSLRFFAAAITLWYFWPRLKSLDWRFGWFGPAAGVAVFLVWIAPVWFQHQPAASPLGQALAALSPTARWTWIAFRVAAAVITVPIAEELAFRGYLARRFIGREFDAVSFSSLTLLSICLSSAVFGLEHMKNLMDWQHLLLGTLAGLAFSAALRWRGRMGDAVAAHAVSNLLLAAWVLGFGDWAQW